MSKSRSGSNLSNKKVFDEHFLSVGSKICSRQVGSSRKMFDSVKFAVIFWINFVACSEESFDRNSAASVMPSELPCDVFFRELPENIQIDYIDSKPLIEFDKKGEKMMGVSDSYCDNAKINLHVDFDPKNQSVVENHTLCFANETFKAESSVYPLLTIMKLPERYVPIHKCMQTAIKYAERVPSMGMVNHNNNLFVGSLI